MPAATETATSIPTATPTPTAPTAPTSTATPTQEAPIGTSTSVPAATTVITTSQLIPTAGAENFEIEYPPKMEVGRSDTVRVSYIVGSSVLIPVIEVEGNQSILGAPIPIGTPGSLNSGLGKDYQGVIVAHLSGAAFDIQSTSTQEYSLLEQRRVDWVWSILPNKEGPQILNLVINVRWEPNSDGKALTYPVYRQRIAINVSVPPFKQGESISLYSTIDTILKLVLGGLITWGASKIYSWVFKPKKVKVKEKQRVRAAKPQTQAHRGAKTRTKVIS
jgi:hypothetical protein